MNKRILWSAGMQTGNRSIDLQHVELIELINALAQLVETSSADREVADALQQLERYVLFHFNMEENMMANSRISPEHVLRHIEAHHAFSTKVEALRQDKDLDSKLPEVVDYLVAWVSNHIMQTDQELVALCRWADEV